MRSSTARRLLVGLIVTTAALVSLSTGTAFAVATAKTITASDVTATTATLTGTVTATDSDTAYAFVYGTSTTYNRQTHPVVARVGLNNATATITGLQPSTTYHFEIIADDAVVEPVRIAQGGDMTFTTLAAPVATTGSATNVTSTAATLTGLANPSSVGYYAFQYGTSTSYTRITTPASIPAGAHNVSARVTGLSPGTVYHFRLVVVQTNPLGSAYAVPVGGADATFTTSSTSPPKQKSGTVSLLSTTIKVMHGKAIVHLNCNGPSSARCAGTIALSVGSRPAGSKRFSTNGHHNVTVKVKLSRRVRKTLKTRHSLGAQLTGTFSTNQGQLSRSVTLLS